MISLDSLPAAMLDDAIRFAHLLCVAIGLGASFFADVYIVRALPNPVSRPLLDILHRCHLIVWAGLIGMWVTGAVLIYLRTEFIWENFSPKLITKGVVVTVLTLNAWIIGTIAMRRVEAALGTSLFALPIRVKLPMGVIAGVSTTSWLLALALGSSSVLAQSSAALLLPLTLGAYGMCVVVSLCAVLALSVGSRKNHAVNAELVSPKT